MKARTKLQQRRHPPTHLDPAAGRLEDARNQLKRRRFTGAVVADQA
jgi:hypothetical protein